MDNLKKAEKTGKVYLVGAGPDRDPAGCGAVRQSILPLWQLLTRNAFKLLQDFFENSV